MDDIEAMRQTTMAMNDGRRLQLDLPIRSWWLVVCAMQLTVTHPGLHDPLKEISEQIGRKIQVAIVEALPDVAEMLEAGWHREDDWHDPAFWDDMADEHSGS